MIEVAATIAAAVAGIGVWTSVAVLLRWTTEPVHLVAHRDGERVSYTWEVTR